MANRYPLIYNPNANQLQELQVGDNLDLSSSGISSVGNINSTGIITATTFSGTFSGTSTLASGLTGSPSIVVTGLYASGVSTFGQDIKLGDNDKVKQVLELTKQPFVVYTLDEDFTRQQCSCKILTRIL